MGLLQDAVVPLESQVNAMTPKFTRMLTMAREEIFLAKWKKQLKIKSLFNLLQCSSYK